MFREIGSLPHHRKLFQSPEFRMMCQEFRRSEPQDQYRGGWLSDILRDPAPGKEFSTSKVSSEFLDLIRDPELNKSLGPYRFSVDEIVRFVESATGVYFENELFFWKMWQGWFPLRKYKVLDMDVYIKVLEDGSDATTTTPTEFPGKSVLIEAPADHTMVRELVNLVQVCLHAPGSIPPQCLGVPGTNLAEAFEKTCKRITRFAHASYDGVPLVLDYGLQEHVRMCPYKAVRSCEYVKKFISRL